MINLHLDHIEYIGDLIGREHVGLGSDFDGIYRYFKFRTLLIFCSVFFLMTFIGFAFFL